jgi:hypothetical protein
LYIRGNEPVSGRASILAGALALRKLRLNCVPESPDLSLALRRGLIPLLIAADKDTNNSANQAANYGEDYGLSEACGGSSVSTAKKSADRSEYADGFG